MLSFGYLWQWVKVINQNFPETKKQDQKTVDVSIAELIVSFSQLGWKKKVKRHSSHCDVFEQPGWCSFKDKATKASDVEKKKYSDI